MDWTQATLFEHIPEERKNALLDFLAGDVRRFRVKAGETILRAGEIPQYQILVERGVLRSIHYTNNGEELSTFYYPPGASIFHIACLTQNPIQSYCMAAQDSQFVTIPRERFIRAVDTFPEFERNLLLYICKTSEQLIEHAVTVQMKRPRQRICRYLIENTSEEKQECQLPFNTAIFANYLNLARPTLSKELHQLESDGLIEIRRKVIRVLNIEALCDELN